MQGRTDPLPSGTIRSWALAHPNVAGDVVLDHAFNETFTPSINSGPLDNLDSQVVEAAVGLSRGWTSSLRDLLDAGRHIVA